MKRNIQRFLFFMASIFVINTFCVLEKIDIDPDIDLKLKLIRNTNFLTCEDKGPDITKLIKEDRRFYALVIFSDKSDIDFYKLENNTDTQQLLRQLDCKNTYNISITWYYQDPESSCIIL